MSEEIEWSKTPDVKYQDSKTGEMSLSTALYDSECTECGAGLNLVLDPDPDSPRWTAECCGEIYTITVSKVTMDKYDSAISTGFY